MGTQVQQSTWGCYFLPNCHGRTQEAAACDRVFVTMGSNCHHSGIKGTGNSSSGSAGLAGREPESCSNTGGDNSIHRVTLKSDRSVSNKFGQLQG